MQVINVKTGKPEELDPVGITEGLASGTHIPAGGQGVLFNPEGNLVFVPGEDVAENVYKYGYKVPNPDELRKAGRDFTYGTDTAQLQAGLAGAARGGTFGISDLLAVKTGLTSPEHLSALKEYYPGTSIAGEIAGALGTAFIPVSPVGALVKGARAAEAMAVGKAAAALPAAKAADVIAKAAVETGGKALGGAIEGMAFGLGQTVSEAALGDPDLTAEKVMANIGYGGLMGGALGATFHVGSIGVKKAYEKAKNVYGDLYESLIGKRVFKPVTEAPPVPGLEVPGEVPGEAAAPMTEQVFEPGPVTKFAAKVASGFSGKPEAEILENIANKMDPTKVVLTSAEKAAMVKQFTNNVQDLYKSLDSVSRRVSTKFRPQETATLLEETELYGPLRQLQVMQDDIKAAVAKIDAEPELYSKNIRRKLEMWSERLDKKPIESFKNANDVFKEIDLFKSRLDKMSKYEKRLEAVGNIVEADTISEIVSPLASKLRAGLEMPEIWGEAGARQAAYNNKISQFLRAKKGLERYLMAKVEGISTRPIMEVDPVKVNTFFNMVNEERSKFRNRAVMNYFKAGRELIEEIEKTAGKVPSEKLDVNALRQFVEKTSDEALKAKTVVEDAFGGFGYFRDLMDAARSGGLTGMAAQIGTAFTKPEFIINRLANIESISRKTSQAVEKSSKFIFEKVKPPTKGAGIIIEKETTGQRTERYKKAIEKLKNLSDVPDSMLNDLDNATRETFEYAPKISQGLQLAAVRATGFLLSKMPQSPDKGILDEPYEPSQAQIITFMRYNDVVNNPLIALQQLEDNYVPRETLETLKTVYPSLYADMKQSIIGQLTDKIAGGKVDLPYQKRVVLSQFLEMPLDSSFRPDIMAKNQQSLAVIGQKAEAKEAEQRAVRPSQTGLGKVSLSSRNQTSLEKVASRA